MNVSLDDFGHFWLLLRWGLPLLAVILICYHFAINYLHKRAEEMGAIAELANARRKLGLEGAVKGMSEAKTCAETLSAPRERLGGKRVS